MITSRHSVDHLGGELMAKARSLFDQVSPEGGPIRYHDLASRWPEYQMQQHFPLTFLHCLTRITPPNGMLTFERFCAGLRLAVVEERENQKQPTPIFGRQQMLGMKSCTPPVPPIRSVESAEKTRQLKTVYGSTQSMTGQGSPQPPPYNQALSRSRLNLDQQEQKNMASMKLNALLAKSTPQLYQGSPKSPQNGHGSAQNGHLVQGRVTPAPPQKIAHNSRGHQQMTNGSRPSSVQSTDSGSLEGIKFQHPVTNGQPQVVVMRNKNGPKAVGPDTRRHTMIEESGSTQSKHARISEEEKDLLKKAADTAHRLYNWYNERLSSLETREKLVGKSMIPLDYAVHEEKLNYLRAHITEVNRRAVALMESSDKGFPWHMNLELHRNIPQPADDQLMWLKRQNKMLTDEVSEKSDRITLLEVEKTRLLKQLCESPNSNYKPVIHQPQTNPYMNGHSHQNPTSGTDSGFHSLTHPSGPLPPNGHSNGHHPPPRPPHQYQNGVVYATPSITVHNGHNGHNGHGHQEQIRYREPMPPPPPSTQQRVHAELHKPPTERHNGILATLM